MFLNLFYGLREAGVPVGIPEWMTLIEALSRGMHGSSLERFYHISRACLVKSEAHFDAFDRVFGHIFQGVELGEQVADEVMRWLDEAKSFPELTDEQKAMLESLDRDELMRRFMETLAEQDERHDGGGRWVGTGGRSPYGHGGYHPTGIRVGGPGQRRMAMKVWEERQFQDYRVDSTLDVRQIRVALRSLRQLTRKGLPTELDVQGTIDETCRNAGEIEFVYRPERRNNVRLLLLMDVGGTMDPYYEPVSRLLTALVGDRSLRQMRAYYFHNCIYELVGTTAELYRKDAVPTAKLLQQYDERWKVMIVGDAAMHPAELLAQRGNIDPRREVQKRGVDFLHGIREHFERVVWINPDPEPEWDHSQTCKVIKGLFPMYHLSVQGLSEAVGALVGGQGQGRGPVRH